MLTRLRFEVRALNSSQLVCVLAFIVAGGIFFTRKRVSKDEVVAVEEPKARAAKAS